MFILEWEYDSKLRYFNSKIHGRWTEDKVDAEKMDANEAHRKLEHYNNQNCSYYKFTLIEV